MKKDYEAMGAGELERLILTLEEEMHEAAGDLRFEYAARLRDEINDLKRSCAPSADGLGTLSRPVGGRADPQASVPPSRMRRSTASMGDRALVGGQAEVGVEHPPLPLDWGSLMWSVQLQCTVTSPVSVGRSSCGRSRSRRTNAGWMSARCEPATTRSWPDRRRPR